MYIIPFGNPLDKVQRMAFELAARTCRGSRSLWKRLRALGFVPAFVLGVLACAPSVAAQTAPTANAGAEGATVTLDSTGSRDLKGQALTYTWSQTGGTTVTLSSASTVSPTFTAPTTTAPTVGSVGFFGNPYRGDAYGVGERISIAGSFDNPVSVIGIPQVALTIGTRRRYATFYYAPADGRHRYDRQRGAHP